MRLDKYLSYSGYGTRKEVKQLIRKKHVYVNDVLCCKDDVKINEKADQVRVDDTIIDLRLDVYIMLHKPAGVICATEDAMHETVLDVIQEPLPPACFPVGRLDIDTEGLVLITNDGKLAHELLSPKKHIDKTYYVESKKPLKEKDIQRFQKGITIDGEETCLPAIVESINETAFLLTIQEGKYHQIKRMLKAVENEVTYLKRIAMGSLHLDESLALGEYRYLSETEIRYLKERKDTI